jgi:hypothetical protein
MTRNSPSATPGTRGLFFTCDGCGPVAVRDVIIPKDHVGNFYCPTCGYDCLYEHELPGPPVDERERKAMSKRDKALWNAAHWRALWVVAPRQRLEIVWYFWLSSPVAESYRRLRRSDTLWQIRMFRNRVLRGVRGMAERWERKRKARLLYEPLPHADDADELPF